MTKKQLTTDDLITKLQKNIAARQAKMTPAERKAEAKKAQDDYRRKYRQDFRGIEWELDLNGHFLTDENLDIPGGRKAHEEALDEIKSHIDFASSMREGDYSRPVKGKKHQLIITGGHSRMNCHKCGGQPDTLIDKKTKKAVVQGKCPRPKGYPEFAVEINVPSGKLIFANDLRQFYPVAVDLGDGTAGNELYSSAHAAHGLIIIYTGNTCPGVYQSGNTLTIGGANTSGESDKPLCNMKKLYGKRVAGICTDLWWYCAVDHDDLKKRVEALIPTWKADFAKEKKPYDGPESFAEFLTKYKDRFDFVNVEPGCYRATSRMHLARAYEQREYLCYSDAYDLREQLAGKEPRSRRRAKFETAIGKDGKPFVYEVKPKPPAKEELKRLLAEAEALQKAVKKERPPADIYSVISRVGACRKIKANELMLKEMEPLSFEDYIKVARLSYASIYPTRNSVLSHTFCSIGNGMEWRNGSLSSTSNRHSVARAKLRAGAKVTFEKEKKFDDGFSHYFDLHDDYSRVAHVPDDVKPDWLAGAYETLDEILKLDPKGFLREKVPHAPIIKLARKIRTDLDTRFRNRPEYASVLKNIKLTPADAPPAPTVPVLGPLDDGALAIYFDDGMKNCPHLVRINSSSDYQGRRVYHTVEEPSKKYKRGVKGHTKTLAPDETWRGQDNFWSLIPLAHYESVLASKKSKR